MDTKVCTKCGHEFAITEFHKNKRSKTGFDCQCKDCRNSYGRESYRQNSAKTISRIENYRKNNPEKHLAARLSAHRKNPTKHNAQQALNAAVKAGVVTKPKRCKGCGSDKEGQKLESHHYDYSEPLDVTWLCRKCHVAIEQVKREFSGLPYDARAKKIIQLSLDGVPVREFDSISIASRSVGVCTASIARALVNERFTCAGYRWRYAA